MLGLVNPCRPVVLWWLRVMCCSFRWWWATLTLWSSPDRTLSRNRRNWRSCLSTIPEQSDRAGNSNNLNLFHWSRDQRCSAGTTGLLSHCWSWWWASGMVEFTGEALKVLKISTHLNYQQTGSAPIWTMKSEKTGLEADWSSGRSSSHQERSAHLHFPPWVNLQQFAPGTSHPAVVLPKPPVFHFVIQPNVDVFMSLVLLLFSLLQYLKW